MHSRVVHFVGGPKNGDIEPLPDNSRRQLIVRLDTGENWRYELHSFPSDGAEVWLFVMAGMPMAHAMRKLLENTLPYDSFSAGLNTAD